MFHQAWRDERDFFYDPALHGLDLQGQKSATRLTWTASPAARDFNYLFAEMLGDITVGHMFVGGGDSPEPKRVKGGLLGRRLYGRERPIPLRPRLQRRELESQAARPVNPARRQRRSR